MVTWRLIQCSLARCRPCSWLVFRDRNVFVSPTSTYGTFLCESPSVKHKNRACADSTALNETHNSRRSNTMILSLNSFKKESRIGIPAASSVHPSSNTIQMEQARQPTYCNAPEPKCRDHNKCPHAQQYQDVGFGILCIGIRRSEKQLTRYDGL